MTRRQAAIAALLSGSPLAFGADDRPIGSLNAYGDVKLGSTPTPTGATVFDGQVVSTGSESRALVTLQDNPALSLGANSRAALRRDAVTLLEGSGQFRTTRLAPARLFAAQLRLEPASEKLTVQAALLENGRVTVAVADGAVRVVDPSGHTLETISAGSALLFGLAAAEAQTPGQGRSGGQAPGVPEEKKDEKKKEGGKPSSTPRSSSDKPAGGGGSHAAVYVIVGAAAAGGIGAAVALGGSKRGS